MMLRPATMDDAKAVLEWKNDPLALAMSKNTKPISVAGHMAWFEQSLAGAFREILIAHEDARPVGMVRFDRDDDDLYVSINVAPAERGRGYGRRMLDMALSPNQSYVAEIRPENTASLRLFAGCGFRRVDTEGAFVRMERVAVRREAAA